MLNITNEEIEILKKLQGIEDEATGIKRTLSQVESEISVRKDKLNDSQQKLAQSEAALIKVRKEYKDLEIESEERDTRLKKSEDYLRTVSSNTEYQLLLREIDDNKKRNAELEVQMIEYLDQIEKEEKTVKESREAVETISSQVEKEVKEIEINTVTERKILEEISVKRDQVAVELNPRLYKRFSTIVERSAGKGIVPVINSTCGGCFMSIPPQMYIEIQRAENLYFCPQCQRMLYYKEEE